MDVLKNKIEKFLAISSGSGYGYGSGSGNGYGSGSGDGDGYGNGNGYGYGSGDGSGDGYGSGSGYGYGSGSGYGYGSGSGNGSGDGYGDGYGNGNGYGYGYGISEINGHKVYKIDGVPTIITDVRGNIAQGYTLKSNVNLVPCYIAKVGDCFAHGETSHKAYEDALAKALRNEPIEQRIARVIKKYPTLDTVVSHKELYKLHNILTGSCEFGRKEFAKAHNLDPDKGEMTMREFINLTSSAYGGDAIKELLHAYTDK